MGGDSLDPYRAKRDFDQTPEPAGDVAANCGSLCFVVQRHRARRTHYDFRLEVDGVLASWAMPKGPTLDPDTKSLAVHVEDHPMEYRDFEGVIPKGQYGGGDVIVWDRGTWELSKGEDPKQAVDNGELHFDLFGEKLKGRFVLVKTRRQGKQEQWIMLHKHDDFSVAGWSPDDHPESVKSGRTNDEVAASPNSVWHSDRPAAEAEIPTGSPPARTEIPTWEGPTEDELAALDALGPKGTWVLQGTEVPLTNLDKILFPAREGRSEDGVTKRDLVRYYAIVAPYMLPYLYDRPVNLNRFPNGSDGGGFWHKEAPAYAPEWITRWKRPDAADGKSEHYFVVDNPPALAWMANYAAVELHPWTAAMADTSKPTWALIDIDPGVDTSPDDVLVLARLFRTGLEHLGVTGAPKTTGQRGIHIWIPVDPIYSFSETSKWVEKLSRAVGATVPDLVSWNWAKSHRKGLARLDYTQNASNKTLVAPYSVRPALGAPVSMPITWDELDEADLRADRWTVRDTPGRLAEVGDLFRPVLEKPQRLPDL